MVYSNQFAVGNKPIGIASLSAIAKREGHAFELFDCTQFHLLRDGGSDADWNLAGAKTLAFKAAKNAERLPPRTNATYAEMIERLIRAIDAFKPDMIGLSALTDDYPLGLGLMREVKLAFPNVPTIAGGVHATVDPGGVLSESCFDMVCVGEGEYVMLDLAQRIDAGGGNFSGIKNLWLKKPDGSIERNNVRPYEQNLDLLPFPDWSIYPETSFYKPFLGHVYKYGDFEMSRGCPYKCSYCINVQLHEIYKSTGSHSYHREKSIPRVMQELRWAVEEHDIEFLKFWDETFLLMSQERMEEFRDLYAEFKIPYVIETTGQSITPFSVKVLSDTNCRSASLGMETGNPDIRKGLLSKPVDNQVYVNAFGLMEKNGIQKVSFNMIGLPNESQADIFRTIGLNRLVGTDTQSVGIFYPYKGSPIRNMMIRDGLLDDDFDLRDLADYDFNTFTAGNRSVVKFKDMDSRLLNRLWMLFSSYCFWPVELFALIDYVKNNDDELAVTLQNNIQHVTYFKKFGEWPDDECAGANAPVPALPKFKEAQGAEFATLLLTHWVGAGRERVEEMLAAIARGEMKPEFEMPSDKEQLAAWLNVDLFDSSEHRRVRAEMRSFAQENSRAYTASTVAAEI